MKWRTEGIAIGTQRVVKRFALWPVDLKDGYTVWLGFYDVHQLRVMHPDGPFGIWETLGKYTSYNCSNSAV